MKQNILFILNSLCFGGAEKQVVSLLNNLDTENFNLFLIFLKNDTTLLPQIKSDRLKEAVLFETTKFNIHAAKDIGSYIDNNEIDIVLCTNAFPLLYGSLARFFSKRRPKIIEVFHSTALQTLKENIYMALFFPLFWLSDALVYVCKNQKRYWSIRALRAKKTLVIYNGVDTEFFSDTYSPDQKINLRQQFDFTPDDYIVGICAAMRPEKYHTDLLLAIKNLKDKGILVKALLIGDGPMKGVIEQQIEKLGLTSQAKVTGYKEDVRPFISICDAMAITSHSEAFSIASLEAMSLGKPMIMSNVGGASEQIEHDINGYIYQYGNIPALSDALQKLSIPQKRQQMGAAAQNMVKQRFSLKSMISSYSQLFPSLVRAK